MTVAKVPQFALPRFESLDDYLAADLSDLPGRYEYWDGELIPTMTESIGNINIANYLFAMLLQLGCPLHLICLGQVEVVVPGNPKTRYPDVTILDQIHSSLLSKKATITRDMPPPRLLMEVVSPGDENSDNYKRDYQEKTWQYAAIAVQEYWLIDPNRAVIWVGTLAAGAYEFQEFRGDRLIESSTFPLLQLTADQILHVGL
jgi:Uma2 family endonuclease